MAERWTCPRGHRVVGNYCTIDGSYRDSPEALRQGAGRTQEPFIEIRPDWPKRPHRFLGFVRTREHWRGLLSAILPPPKIETANRRLRMKAAKRGADAVIGVTYRRGRSAFSWKVLEAEGSAVEYTDT